MHKRPLTFGASILSGWNCYANRDKFEMNTEMYNLLWAEQDAVGSWKINANRITEYFGHLVFHARIRRRCRP